MRVAAGRAKGREIKTAGDDAGWLTRQGASTRVSAAHPLTSPLPRRTMLVADSEVAWPPSVSQTEMAPSYRSVALAVRPPSDVMALPAPYLPPS